MKQNLITIMKLFYPNFYVHASWSARKAYLGSHIGTSILKTFIIFCIFVNSFVIHASARASAEEVALPSSDGWSISAVRRMGNSISCRAEKKDVNGVEFTILTNSNKYRGGIWFLAIVSPHQQLKLGDQEVMAHLTLNGIPSVEGKALNISDTIGNRTIKSYIRFEFTAIDGHLTDIESAKLLEIRADGLAPIKIESLTLIIAAVKKCMKDSINPIFWKNANRVCN